MSNIFKKGYRYKIVIHLFFILMCLTFVVPMILVISISFSSEASVTAVGAGYSLIPKEFSLEAYQLAFANPEDGDIRIYSDDQPILSGNLPVLYRNGNGGVPVIAEQLRVQGSDHVHRILYNAVWRRHDPDIYCIYAVLWVAG